MAKVLPLQRVTFTRMLERMQEHGPKAKGVIAVWIDREGKAEFHITGFNDPGDSHTAVGLLEWVKLDIGADLVDSTYDGEAK